MLVKGIKRLALQLFLWGVTGAYYIWCWIKSGQTLAMQAWKISLVTEQNHLLNLKLAVMRYILATLSFAAFGLGFYGQYAIDKVCFYMTDYWIRNWFYRLSM